MSPKEEGAPLLMPKPASSSLPAQNIAAGKSITATRPRWHNIQHPDVRLELILYGELAAVAALVVAVYLMALLPWDYVQRSQLISARMTPAGVEIVDVEQFAKKCPKRLDLNANKSDPYINEFVNLHLTARPCGLADWSNMVYHDKDCFEMPSNTDCGCVQHPNNAEILPRVLQISTLQTSKMSYHDMMMYGHLSCCKKDANPGGYCPCGFRLVDGNCLGFSHIDCAYYKKIKTLDKFNHTSPEGKKFLDDNEITQICTTKQSYLRVKPCPTVTELTFLNELGEELVLCESDLFNPYSWQWMHSLRSPLVEDNDKV